MKKEIFIALFCTGLVFITPLTSIAQENKVNNSLSEQIDVNGLVVQIKTVMNEILEKYGHIPFVSNFGNLILNLLELIDKIIFCITLIIIFIPVAILFIFLGLVLGFKYIAYNIGAIALVLITEYDRNCPPGTPLFDWLSPLKTIYTLKDIDDITNLIEDCPCLQE